MRREGEMGPAGPGWWRMGPKPRPTLGRMAGDDPAAWADVRSFPWRPDDPGAAALKSLVLKMLGDRPYALTVADPVTGQVAMIAMLPEEYRAMEAEWREMDRRRADLEEKLERAISSARAILARWPDEGPAPTDDVLMDMKRLEDLAIEQARRRHGGA